MSARGYLPDKVWVLESLGLQEGQSSEPFYCVMGAKWSTLYTIKHIKEALMQKFPTYSWEEDLTDTNNKSSFSFFAKENSNIYVKAKRMKFLEGGYSATPDMVAKNYYNC